MKKIVFWKDEKNFGNETLVFDNEKNYLVIMIECGIAAYYFLDLSLSKLYPANSYMKEINFTYNTSNCDWGTINFDINLDRYGFSICPDWLRVLIKERKT